MRPHIPILLCLAGVAASVPARSFDHYDPSALMAQARVAMREDDLRTACVLLWRADQLAPHDARMRAFWDELDARVKGRPVVEAPAPRAEAAAPKAHAAGAPTRTVAPEPPAPWAAK